MKKKIVIIDNYDSFTYNLAHQAKHLGAEVNVKRNDKFVMEELEPYDGIILSPGPGIPSEAGLLLDVIRTYAGKKPILGVCLGHQAIAETMGAKLRNLDEVVHGIATEGINIGNDPIFEGVAEKFTMGRYHSWVVDKDGLPESLVVTAESNDGYIMAIRHREYNIHGIQFHPESILTPDGETIVRNWLQSC